MVATVGSPLCSGEASRFLTYAQGGDGASAPISENNKWAQTSEYSIAYGQECALIDTKADKHIHVYNCNCAAAAMITVCPSGSSPRWLLCLPSTAAQMTRTAACFSALRCIHRLLLPLTLLLPECYGRHRRVGSSHSLLRRSPRRSISTAPASACG